MKQTEQIQVFLIVVLVLQRGGTIFALLCNVAMCRQTTQASQISGISLNLTQSCNAVDGIPDPIRDHGSCMETRSPDTTEGSWWQVDLGDVYNVTYLNLTMREDQNISDFWRAHTVHIGNTLENNSRLNAPDTCDSNDISLDMQGGSVRIDCSNPVAGRYLEIVQSPTNDKNKSLSFCEIGVYVNISSTFCPTLPENWNCSSPLHSPCFDASNTQNVNVMSTEKMMTTNALPPISSTTTTQMPTTSLTTTTQMPIKSSTTTTQMQIPSLTTTTMMPTTLLTTTLDTVSTLPTNDSQICYCMCSHVGVLNLSDLEISEKIEKIVQEIKVDPKQTSSAKRKLISVKDSRPSAKAIGSLGVAILVFVATVIFLMDANIWVRSVGQCKPGKENRRNTARRNF